MNKLIIKLYLIIKLKKIMIIIYTLKIVLFLKIYGKRSWILYVFYMNFHSTLKLKLYYFLKLIYLKKLTITIKKINYNYFKIQIVIYILK